MSHWRPTNIKRLIAFKTVTDRFVVLGVMDNEQVKLRPRTVVIIKKDISILRGRKARLADPPVFYVLLMGLV